MASVTQEIRFCRARDGARIAMAKLGKGPPLLRAAHWLSHVEYDARSPVWTHGLRELARDHTYIRYDQRGCGLSDRSPPTASFESWIGDLEAVVEAQSLDRFTLLGMSQGGATAVAYAARHPEKVSRLVLLGAYGRGMLRRDASQQQRDEADTLLKLIRLGWGRDNPAYRQIFTSQFMPDGTREQQQWFNELERISASPENAAAIVETLYQVDVTPIAKTLQVPTLIFHVRNDGRVPFEEGLQLASLIPGARFIPLEGRNHVLLESDPAWHQFVAELRNFLAVPGEGSAATAEPVAERFGLTRSEREVLVLIARGMDNAAIAAALSKREKTVRNQVTSIFAKLGVNSRAQAVALARDANFGADT
jgi:pimeloyl-ACP methyl ester carboxylesterase/DNA-binding CsgD family transcriptional regulator